MRGMRRAAVVVAVGAAGALALPATAADVSVRVGSFYFEDGSTGDGRVTVDQGDRIVFRFEGDAPHTATVDSYFDSGTRSPGGSYTTPALTRAGTFTLYCQVHGATRHVATLTVRAGAPASPTPTTARPSPSRTAAASKSPSPRPTQTRPASPSPRPTSASPRPSSARPSPSKSPSPSASPSSASPSAAVVDPTPSDEASDEASPTPGRADGPDVTPAVALDDGIGWLLPLALVLFAAGLGAGAIALGKRRRTD